MCKSIVLVAGGTGGHILPAISFGNWIEKNKKDYDVFHICGSRKLESEIHFSAGTSPFIVEMEGSPLSGKNLFQRFQRLIDLIKTFFKMRVFLSEKKPVCCILFAGYISLPAMLACKSLGIYTVLHEQNAYAGKVTRIAEKLGIEIYSGWKQCSPLHHNNFMPIGVPVRELIQHSPENAWKSLGFECELPQMPKVVVFTGSLGSPVVKDMIIDISKKDKFKNLSFILPAVSQSIEKVDENVYLLPKVWNVALLYSIADMVVVRAGGSTLSEVANSGIPALIVPWNKAADNHQNCNAVAYVAENDAIIHNESAPIEDFEKKLYNLYNVFTKKEEKSSAKRYNDKSSKICENFWFALSPKFERRT